MQFLKKFKEFLVQLLKIFELMRYEKIVKKLENVQGHFEKCFKKIEKFLSIFQ